MRHTLIEQGRERYDIADGSVAIVSTSRRQFVEVFPCRIIMHICLLVSIEVLTNIFAAIYEGSSKENSLRTFAALARTCRRFKEPALNALWKDMDSFMPLILCLPEDVRECTTVKGRSQIQWVS